MQELKTFLVIILFPILFLNILFELQTLPFVAVMWITSTAPAQTTPTGSTQDAISKIERIKSIGGQAKLEPLRPTNVGHV